MSARPLGALEARARRFARELWVYLLLAALLTTILAASNEMSDPTRISALFVGNLVLSLSMGATCELGGALLALLSDERRTGARGVALLGATLAVCAAVGAELALALLGLVAPETSRMFPHKAVLLISLPVTFSMAGLAMLRDRGLEERVRRRELEQKLGVMRLAALSARTEPHFLFNSLNGVAALIPEDPVRAERAVLRLASLFRYVLEGSRAAEVPLAAEVEFVRAYLELELLRFGEQVSAEVAVAPDCLDARVPPLALQPLVENALRHGLSAPRRVLRVVLRAISADGELVITVDDDGPGPSASRHRGAGTSHADLRQRLRLMYGDRAELTTCASPLGGFRAMLRIPRSRSDEGADRR